MPFIGRYVEIIAEDVTFQGKRLQLPQMTVDDDDLEQVDVAGQTGVCLSWRSDLLKYLVKTFENIVAYVPEENLLLAEPTDPLEGGFDLTWPADGEVPMELGSAVANRLWENGFCVMKMFMGESDRTEMVQQAEDVPTKYRMKQEIEAAYLGIDSNTKVSLRKVDTPQVKVQDAMTSSDRTLTTLTRLLHELPTESLGLNSPIKKRTNAMLRTSYKNSSEAEEIAPESLAILPDNLDWEGDLKGWANFVCERSICLLYMVENEGGDIWLYPNNAKNSASMRIPVSPGNLLLFRHDHFDYSYQPIGKSLALQSWILKDRDRLKEIKQLEINFEEKKARLNPGHPQPPADPAYIMACHSSVPMDTGSEEQLWTLYAAGNDTCTEWPRARWELEPYYMEGQEAVAHGKSYTKHGGFMSDAQICGFDCKFFGMSVEESTMCLYAQRITLEVGYTCLCKAGYSRYTLNGEKIGCWVGDSGQDWHSFHDIFPVRPEQRGLSPKFPELVESGVHVAYTAGRLQFVFGMKGPTSSYDTACSASLIALNGAHAHMMAAGAENTKHLVWGANSLMGPSSFIGNCAGGMLTHKGRCWTFTSGADGYQRGEGVSMFYVSTTETEEKLKNKLTTLVGSSMAHGGRSASITAPNGPAQTMLIQKSMRQAGFDLEKISVAEMHGTGTSLGDPIEVGAYASVFKGKREMPVFMSTQKTNYGHMEANAGSTGLLKCICLSRVWAAPPNCHLNDLNPNISTHEDGFPVFFDSEVCDCAISTGYVGVSSFGFGGAYARADLFTECNRGPNKLIELDLPRPSLPAYAFDAMIDQVCIIGSWNQFSVAEDMQIDSNGVCSYLVRMGDSCHERFRFMLGRADDRVIYPGIKKADASAQVLGPDMYGEDRYWVIDGREDGMPEGAAYQIMFQWNDKVKQVWWEPVPLDTFPDLALTLKPPAVHEYFITGSFTGDRLVPMTKVTDDDGTYHLARFEIGCRWREEFHIVMDQDPEYTFFLGIDSSILGPDECGGAGKFRIEGKQLESVTIKFRITSGYAFVTAETPSISVQWGTLPASTVRASAAAQLPSDVSSKGAAEDNMLDALVTSLPSDDDEAV